MTRASRGRRWTEGRPQSPLRASPCAQDTTRQGPNILSACPRAKQPLYHVLALTLGAFALRLYQLDAQGLWADEGGSADFAAMPLRQLIATVAREEPHP